MKPFFVQLNINPKLYLKDPQKTELGKKIIEQSVLLIDKIGLEQFSFKKLAAVIPASEASIYRYFENKHKLFVYLLNWYWEWMIVNIELSTMNITDPMERLKRKLSIIVDSAKRNTAIEFVDEDILHKIVVREGTKAYRHIDVDENNDEGFFYAYKKLCKKLAETIQELNPDFPYPKALANTLIETANNNLYFARHLPRLTDVDNKSNELDKNVTSMLEFFSIGLLTFDKGLLEMSKKRLISEV